SSVGTGIRSCDSSTSCGPRELHSLPTRRSSDLHIGASGIVYALAFFLIFFGVFYRDFRSLIITVVVFLLYGGVFYGILPGDPHVSWESHLAGALVGIGSALTLSRKS